MDDPRPPLKSDPSLQNIEDALVILALDKVLADGSLGTDSELKELATKSVTARIMRLIGFKEG